jgi:hypothetical protein
VRRPSIRRLVAGATLALSVALGGWTWLGPDAAQAATRAHRPTIYVQNTSTVISNALIRDALPAFQAAVSEDFEPIWNTDAKLIFIGQRKAPAGGWTLSVSDYSDGSALGYHYVTVDNVPYGRVFAHTILNYGESWEVVFTHELFEMLADPHVSRTEWSGLNFYYLEVADPVEDWHYAYYRRSLTNQLVQISDFVTESWYVIGAPGPYDFKGYVKHPLQLLPGGYVSVYEGGDWHQIFKAV